MSKSYFIIKFFKNINLFINKLLEKNLNKLNSKNLVSIIKSNKIFVTSVALTILFLSYLSIPNIYKQKDVVNKLKDELFTKFNLNTAFSKKLHYNFFPRPHFSTDKILLFYNNNEISKINNLKIYISPKNLISLNNINVSDVVFDGANFNLNKDNYKFFADILERNFLNSSLKVLNSNIFYRSIDKEVLFVNKISEMKYYFDQKNLNNILYSENELFNIPYSIEIFTDKDNKKIYTKLNISLLRLYLENQHTFKSNNSSGSANLLFNNFKSVFNYKKKNNLFTFDYFDKKDNQKFIYNGEFFFKPFYSNLKGNTNELNIFYLLNSNSIIPQLLKTEILNNKNLNFNLNLKAKKILNYSNFKNILLNSQIKEGLIDVDGTEFNWRNFANFKLSDSLIYTKDGELILDANTQINILNNTEIYKFLQSPKKLRKKIKKINLNFNLNFDQKIINVNDVRIDDKANKNISEILKNILIKSDDLQNKIYFKKLINKALKNHLG